MRGFLLLFVLAGFGGLDALTAQVSFPNPTLSGGTLPANCTPGSLVPAIFVLTSGNPVTSAQAYQCTALNTWTAIATGSGVPAAPTNSVQKNGGGTFAASSISDNG